MGVPLGQGSRPAGHADASAPAASVSAPDAVALSLASGAGVESRIPAVFPPHPRAAISAAIALVSRTCLAARFFVARACRALRFWYRVEPAITHRSYTSAAPIAVL